MTTADAGFATDADVVSVYVTAADEAEALRLVRALVGARLAACGNVIPAVRSVYHWQGELVEDSEAAFILKTRAALVPVLLARVQALHSYDLPAITVWPIVGCTAAYRDWILAETGATGNDRDLTV